MSFQSNTDEAVDKCLQKHGIYRTAGKLFYQPSKTEDFDKMKAALFALRDMLVGLQFLTAPNAFQARGHMHMEFENPTESEKIHFAILETVQLVGIIAKELSELWEKALKMRPE